MADPGEGRGNRGFKLVAAVVACVVFIAISVPVEATCTRQVDCRDSCLNEDLEVGGCVCASGTCEEVAIDFMTHPRAGVCADGVVPVATVENTLDATGATYWLRVPEGADYGTPLVVMAQSDGSTTLSLSKTARSGTYPMVLMGHFDGSVIQHEFNTTVTCPDHGVQSNKSQAVAQVAISGFTDSDFESGSLVATHNTQELASAVAMALGDGAEVTASYQTHDASSVTVEVVALVGSGHMSENRTVSLALDGTHVAASAGNPTVFNSSKALLFKHCGRTLSRVLEVCCSATIEGILSLPVPGGLK